MQTKSVPKLYIDYHYIFFSEPDGSWALSQAKSNLEKYYTVVGVLEELSTSLSVFESKIPQFFNGASKIYESDASTFSNINKNSNKPQIPTKVKDFIQQKLPNEMEFYNFCKQRLMAQFHEKLEQ